MFRSSIVVGGSSTVFKNLFFNLLLSLIFYFMLNFSTLPPTINQTAESGQESQHSFSKFVFQSFIIPDFLSALKFSTLSPPQKSKSENQSQKSKIHS